ncbi:type II and III secretion system protein [Methylococcus sp. EFPC2]|uniref:type II and III secretion system protein n=1 Tax=Methylococcus sp. EFPC2 TaxID=2812648 RepID=UPI00196772E1|nr:type II and III secretion system protein [Methylococcus sp. EFPC2]QSA95762.1 type II and III secretion system protein [Methylococcus sp. EFPC2]
MKRYPARLSGLLLVLLIGPVPGVSHAQERELATIELRHRLPEEIAAIVQPLLEPGDAVIPSRAGLIVKASPGKLAEIGALIGELDRIQHRLMITVAQGMGLTREGLNARANVAIQIDPRRPADVQIGGRGHVYQTETRETGENTQRVQALEGQPAHIQFGEQIPLPGGQYASPGYGGVILNQGIEYRDVSTGFAVTPRLTGDGRVNLDIEPWSDRLSRRGGGIIESQSARTTLQARIGEWVELGGEIGSAERSQNGLLGHGYSTRSDTRKIFIRVDDLDAGR